MWIRSAYWIGRVKPGHEDAFRRLLDDEIIPAMAALPGVHRVRALWPRRLEDSPPELACQTLVEFATREDLERMMGSEERGALRPGSSRPCPCSTARSATSTSSSARRVGRRSERLIATRRSRCKPATAMRAATARTRHRAGRSGRVARP